MLIKKNKINKYLKINHRNTLILADVVSSIRYYGAVATSVVVANSVDNCI